MLNYCFVIGPSILLFLHILLTETFSKLVDNSTTSVFQMPKSKKSLPSCYFKIKFHFSTGFSPGLLQQEVTSSFEHSCVQA